MLKGGTEKAEEEEDKDDQEARQKAFMEADEKEGALRESIENLLSKFLQSYMIFLSEYLPDTMNCVL
jgi:hypothetical protein